MIWGYHYFWKHPNKTQERKDELLKWRKRDTVQLALIIHHQCVEKEDDGLDFAEGCKQETVLKVAEQNVKHLRKI